METNANEEKFQGDNGYIKSWFHTTSNQKHQ